MPTIEELDRIIDELQLQIPKYPENGFVAAGSYSEFEQLVAGELDFWRQRSSTGMRTEPLQTALEYIRRAKDQTNEAAARDALVNARNHLTNARHLIHTQTAMGRFVESLGIGSRMLGAVHVLMNSIQSQHLSDPEYFAGAMQGWFFREPSMLTNGDAVEAERSAIHDLRAELDLKSADITNVQTAAKSELKQWIAAGYEARDEFTERADKVCKEAHELAAKSLTDSEKTFAESHVDWARKVDATQKAYSAHLMLKKPAEYWRDLAKSYLGSGVAWTIVALLVIILLGAAVRELVYNPPAILLGNEIKLEGIRGALAIGLAISAAVYFIHLLVRLATSGFHLHRDALERHQLTLVYLALLKEGGIDEKERAIVLASIFSRSDSGLLKHDSSSPLPLDTILRSVKDRPSQ